MAAGLVVSHVAMCIGCHSTRDWSKFAGPVIPGTEGMGGEPFTQDFGFPGKYYAKNITPAGIGDWSNEEIERAVATGVSRNGSALFPIMPYPHYALADRSDIHAIIAYVRTLAPKENTPPESSSDFPMNFIINTIPDVPHYIKKPTDNIKYGEYLVNMASCITCHSQEDKGQLIPGTEFGGGREFPLPGFAVVRSSNISPDETGIGSWTREAFIRRFKAYADSSNSHPAVPKGGKQTVMPWTMYAGMTESDLGSIYDFLRTVKPVRNVVDKTLASQ